MGAIVGQADQYAVFDNTPRPERTAREIPEGMVRDYLGGPRVGAGQLNPRAFHAGAGKYLRDLANEQHEDWLNHAGQHGYDPDERMQRRRHGPFGLRPTVKLPRVWRSAPCCRH